MIPVKKKKSPLGLSDYLDNLIGGFWDSQLVLVGKNIPASVGDIRDMGSVPGLGRSPRGGQGNPPKILAWRIPWTEEPGGLQSVSSQRVRHD